MILAIRPVLREAPLALKSEEFEPSATLRKIDLDHRLEALERRRASEKPARHAVQDQETAGCLL